MRGVGSSCGACKFLRRKCVTGCVFAPYFCYEEGASHFAAVHKVFGASNISKLLADIPITDHRCEAAITISYEAQARLEDPIYGCVSQILSLQQEVMYLQAQLASLKEQAVAATQCLNINGPNNTNHNKYLPQDLQNCWFQLENSGTNRGEMHNQFDDPYFSGSSKTGDNMIWIDTNFSHSVFNNNPAGEGNYMSSTTTHEEPNEQWVLLQEDAHMDDLFNLLLSDTFHSHDS